MALAAMDRVEEIDTSLAEVRAMLQDIADRFAAEAPSLSTRDLANRVAAVEDISKTLEYLQAAGAHAVERADLAANGESAAHTAAYAEGCAPGSAGEWANPAAAITSGGGEPSESGGGTRNSDAAGSEKRQRRRKTEFRNNAEYLRSRLGISILEARRRLRVGKAVSAPVRLDGEAGTPDLPELADAMAQGDISGEAAALVTDSIARARHAADPGTLEAMEAALVAQAVESDADTLAMVAKTWETAVDQDGAEPSEEELRARQGMFYRGRRRGLHQFVINTTDDQYELLATVMNSAANPRVRPEAIEAAATGPGQADIDETGAGNLADSAEEAGVGHDSDGPGPKGADPEGTDPEDTDPEGTATEGMGPEGVDPVVLAGLDQFTRAQKLLAGLIGACRIALNVGKLPESGGLRTQMIVTSGYEQLAGLLSGGGSAVYNGSLSAKTVRRLACDAEIIPAVLGSKGEVLDLGRSQRFFSRAIRKALIARDKGCAFPGCTMPALWTEAHHIVPWWAGGRTDVNNGVCLCGLHHDLIEQGNWEINVLKGIPWFTPPDYIDPRRKPLRNTYWQTQVPVRLLRPGPGTGQKREQAAR
ncbi:MAG TPA: DUF222 domain-containing protein [Arthrobacter sp.]|nr:DUF222 domain-containing protein [Arthrobacter sp.]